MLVQVNDSPYETGAKKGDVIVVRPDGWQWGREECPPRYIVVRVKGMTMGEAQPYEEQLMDTTDPENQVLKRIRKYYIPTADVDEAINKNGKIDRTREQKLNNLKIKTSRIEIIPKTESVVIDNIE